MIHTLLQGPWSRRRCPRTLSGPVWVSIYLQGGRDGIDWLVILPLLLGAYHTQPPPTLNTADKLHNILVIRISTVWHEWKMGDRQLPCSRSTTTTCLHIALNCSWEEVLLMLMGHDNNFFFKHRNRVQRWQYLWIVCRYNSIIIVVYRSDLRCK